MRVGVRGINALNTITQLKMLISGKSIIKTTTMMMKKKMEQNGKITNLYMAIYSQIQKARHTVRQTDSLTDLHRCMFHVVYNKH